MVYKVLNITIFLTQMHHLTLEGLYYPPRSCAEHFLWWMDALFWASKSCPEFTAIIKLGRARTFFYITPIAFVRYMRLCSVPYLGVWCLGSLVSPSSVWTGWGLQWRPCGQLRHHGNNHSCWRSFFHNYRASWDLGGRPWGMEVWLWGKDNIALVNSNFSTYKYYLII